MPLRKMSIRNLDLNEKVDDENVKVLFNPTEYSIEQSNTWEAQNTQGSEPRTQFTRADLRKLSMELFVDSYEERAASGSAVDVRTYTHRVSRLMVASVDASEGKRPPIVEVTWLDAPEPVINKDFPFKGVITSLRQQFVLFSEEGCPVRAKLSLSIQEYRTPKEIKAKYPRRNSFPARTYTVREGDTLAGIAQAMWKKPTEWRRIADANRDLLSDPRVVVPGVRYEVPAID